MKIYSSGGCGDALIVGMKIEHMRLWTNSSINEWAHREKHECHRNPCSDIIEHFVPKGGFCLSNNPETESKKIVDTHKKNEALYIDTKIKEFPHPYLQNTIENNFSLSTELWDTESYVCVQTVAGRLHDNTKRYVSMSAIQSLKDRFPDKKLVLVGPEKSALGGKNLINLTGETKSILDVFSIINNCGIFVGQDGVMSYYAAMLGKPTVISYHLPNLLNHYWNNHWSLHSIAMVAGNNVVSLPEGCEHVFKMVK